MRSVASIPAFLVLLFSMNAGVVFAETKEREVVMVCPPSVLTQEVVVSQHPGWRASSYKKPLPKEHKSNMPGFVSEENGKLELLVPTEYEPLPETDGPGVSTWKFTPQTNIFLLCDYSDTDVILLSRPPVGVHQCTIRANDSPQRAVCK